MSDSPPSKSKGRPRGSGSFAWRAFFQQSTTPIYVLGKGRRLRFANAAWEKLTGLKLADALGMVCSTRRHGTPLAAALAPSPEAEAGKSDRVRRIAPTGRSGPPWWDVSFTPLAGNEGLIGIVGHVAVVGEAVATVVRKMPPYVPALRDRQAARFSLDLFAGRSPSVMRFQGQLRHAAGSRAPLWIMGEPGSGKETAARAIHHASAERNKAFVGLACSGLQPYLIESLLFGHGGLMGGELVGTLYLKDPAALPRDLQQRFVELFGDPQPGAPRLICGSYRPAVEDVAAGKLLPAFHVALSVIELRVPPLRERLADLPRLAAHFLDDRTTSEGDDSKNDPARENTGRGPSPSLTAVLEAQAWPGNLRELAGVLADAAESAGEGPIRAEHLPRMLRERAGLESPVPKPKAIQLDSLLEAVERRLIAQAMARSQGSATRAAELLGMLRSRLGRRLEALGMNPGDEKA